MAFNGRIIENDRIFMDIYIYIYVYIYIYIMFVFIYTVDGCEILHQHCNY